MPEPLKFEFSRRAKDLPDLNTSKGRIELERLMREIEDAICVKPCDTGQKYSYAKAAYHWNESEG